MTGVPPMDHGDRATHALVAAPDTGPTHAGGAREEMTEGAFYRILADVTAAVTESLVLATAMERLGRVVVPRLADWCSIHLSVDGEVEAVTIAHADVARIAAAWATDERYGPRIGDDHGVARVLRTGQTEIHTSIPRSALQAVARDADHLRRLADLDITAAVLVPLTRRGQVLGVLTLANEGNRPFEETTMRLAEAIARRAAVAIENAQLYEATERARAEMAETHELLTRLLALSPTLSSAANETTAATTAVRAARELFDAHAASVWRFDGAEIELVARDPEQQHLVPGARIGLAEFPGFTDEVSAGRPSFVPDLVAVYPSLAERAARLGTRSLLRLPLLTSAEPAGLIVVSWDEVRDEPSPARLALGQRFADLAALAMEDGRRRRAEHDRRILHTQLEVSLMPTPRVSPERLTVLSRYVSGHDGLMLAGDFIDAYELPDGSVRAVVGDVVGRGPLAAGRAASLRASWRALTANGLAPLDVLRALDALLLAEGDAGDFVTACTVDIAPGCRSMDVITAGHPAPIVIGEDPAEAPVVVAPPLGLGTVDQLQASTVELPDEWSLLLYTDGLIEGSAGRDSDERFGLTRLLAWLDEHAAHPLTNDDLGRLLEHVRSQHGSSLNDDTAVLVLSRARGRPAADS